MKKVFFEPELYIKASYIYEDVVLVKNPDIKKVHRNSKGSYYLFDTDTRFVIIEKEYAVGEDRPSYIVTYSWKDNDWQIMNMIWGFDSVNIYIQRLLQEGWTRV